MTVSDPAPHSSHEPDVLGVIRTDGLVPLYSSADVESLQRVAEAISAGGLSTFEFTLRGPDAVETLGGIVAHCESAASSLIVGAGTVLDAAAAATAIEAGARFVFSPVVVPQVAQLCADAGIPYIPGCATPTEIHTALELGCRMVKLFPASVIGGPAFLRAVRAVFPDLAAVPTGGIVPEVDHLRQWFASGAEAVAMGSSLFPPFVTDSLDRIELTRRVRAAVASVAEARSDGDR